MVYYIDGNLHIKHIVHYMTKTRYMDSLFREKKLIHHECLFRVSARSLSESSIHVVHTFGKTLIKFIILYFIFKIINLFILGISLAI